MEIWSFSIHSTKISASGFLENGSEANQVEDKTTLPETNSSLLENQWF